jgi:hypothetical protein
MHCYLTIGHTERCAVITTVVWLPTEPSVNEWRGASAWPYEAHVTVQRERAPGEGGLCPYYNYIIVKSGFFNYFLSFNCN